MVFLILFLHTKGKRLQNVLTSNNAKDDGLEIKIAKKNDLLTFEKVKKLVDKDKRSQLSKVSTRKLPNNNNDTSVKLLEDQPNDNNVNKLESNDKSTELLKDQTLSRESIKESPNKNSNTSVKLSED